LIISGYDWSVEIKGVMLMAKIKPFEKYSNKYEDWFTRNRYVYETEINIIKEALPEFNNAIEIGVGSGRFAKPLGITKGLEPSKKMAEIARGRGISVTEGIAEDIPFGDAGFDLALIKPGFMDFSFSQTIFKDIDDINEIEKVKKGYGLGSFVVISAKKP
jgi:ubiquinone/menaquinone biosynthesis C-methylase UbiE